MQEVGCPEPASAVALMEWMRSRVALSASNPIKSLVMKPSLSSCVVGETGNESSGGSYYEFRSFTNRHPMGQAVHSPTENGVTVVQMYLDCAPPGDNSRRGDIIQLLEAGTRWQTTGVNIAVRRSARYIKSFGCSTLLCMAVPPTFGRQTATNRGDSAGMEIARPLT